MKRTAVLIFVILGFCCGAAGIGSGEASAQADVEPCGDIWAVRSIRSDFGGLLIQFDTGFAGFQVVYKIKDGEISLLEYGEFFSVALGETIGWGDGDHAFMSLTVVSSEQSSAEVILTDQHVPPGGKAVMTSRTCRIVEKHDLDNGGFSGDGRE